MSRIDRQAGVAQSILLLAGSCLPVLGAVLLAPILPRMQAHFADTSGAQVLVPIALTIPALMIALLAPFAGLIVDRVGRKPLLLVSMMLYACCGLLPLWLDSLGAIVASRAGLGVAEAGIMTCCTTLIGDYYQAARRERLFALQMVATSLSAAVFIALGGALGQDDWRTPFYLYVIGLVLMPVMAMLLWEPAANRVEASVTHSERFAWNPLLALYLLSVLAGVSLFIVPVQAGYLLTSLHIDSPQQIGMTMGANQLGVLAGALLFSMVARVRRPWLLLLAFGLAGLGGLAMAQAASQMTMIVAVMINGMGVGLLLPTLVTWVMSLVSFSQRGKAAGGFTAALFLGEFLSPLAVLGLNGQTASLPQTLTLIALVQLGLAVACLALPRVFQALARVAPSTT